MHLRKVARREFLQTASLAAMAAGLSSCRGLDRLIEAPSSASTITPPRSPSPLFQPSLHAESPTIEGLSAGLPTIDPTSTASIPTKTAQATIAPAVKAAPTATPAVTAQLEADLGLKEALFYNQLDGEKVACQVCFRGCIVPEGGRGFCRNKVNHDGRYYTLVYGKPSAMQLDPIEKEPHFHMYPGGTILCTGTASCNSRCQFCQNWHLSQRSIDELPYYQVSPELTITTALEMENDAVSFTYNEPTVFYEHMLDVTLAAKEAGLGTLFHTNGSMQEEPLARLLEHMDAVTVDLKAFTAEFYQEVCSNELEPVLRTLQQIHESPAHLEIVNLVVTTLNDDMDDIRRMCSWIREALNDEVPLHFTRFFPAYRLTSLPATPIETLESAIQIADQEGLKYVYIGNVPGHLRNSTFCPNCGERIIWRTHFAVHDLQIEKGHCSFCDHPIPGIWRDV